MFIVHATLTVVIWLSLSRSKRKQNIELLDSSMRINRTRDRYLLDLTKSIASAQSRDLTFLPLTPKP